MSHSPEDIAREERQYFRIFGWLAFLTIAEIAVTYVPVGKVAIGAMLVLLAGTKAAMVALYYMHLSTEHATLTWIALTPAIICVFLIFMLLPDVGALNRIYDAPKAPAAEAHH